MVAIMKGMTAGFSHGVEHLDGLADVHSMPLYPHVAEMFGVSQSFTLLLRPDNYIGYIGAGMNIEGAREYLRKVLS